MAISSIRINNTSHDIKDKNAISLAGIKAKQKLNNILSFEDSDLYTLSNEQIEKIFNGEIDEVLPLGTIIHLPSVTITDDTGIGSGSITFTEPSKEWRFAGMYGNYMIFVMNDDDTYIAEDADQEIYPYNLTAIREMQNTVPSQTTGIWTQYGFSTPTDFYNHMMDIYQETVRKQFREFFNNHVVLGDIQNMIARLPFTQRVVSSSSAAIQQACGFFAYRSDGTGGSNPGPNFDVRNNNTLGFLSSYNVFGSPVLPQHLGRVIPYAQSYNVLSQRDLNTYTYGSEDDIAKFQFPLFKYCDDMLIGSILKRNFLFDEKRLSIKFTSTSQGQLKGAFPGILMNNIELIQYESTDIQQARFLPFVLVGENV